MASEARLIRVLALLDSDNDAEALQALRTAHRLLGQLGLSFTEIASRNGKPSDRAVGAKQGIKSRTDDRETLVLRAELQRFRAMYDQVCREKVDAVTEIERLKSFLKAKQNLPLFQRLRDREENVRSLTREVGRLRDELFVQERRTRELERQLASDSVSSVGARPKRRRAQSSQARCGPEQVDERQRVRSWVQKAGLSFSHEQTDWVSFRRLYRLFRQERLALRDGRIVEMWGESHPPPRMTQARFVVLLREALGVGLLSKNQFGDRSGFCVVSNLDLSEGAEQRSLDVAAPANVAREQVKKRVS